ncbi:MAG TPA: matrixin family metalloprotease [Gemmataceae bacterium]|nr:matrixin family metalloprotease [Gemmataceae bacterium]
MARSRRLMLEALEDRATPAVFGVPWSDPTQLTLSFAPDGTRIGTQASSLFATLDAQEPAAAWQAIIMRALQAWAINTNLNIGVVADNGQPFGASGSGEGRSRFGNIRIGAAPLSPDVLAVSVPHDPYLSGNWSGDVILNSTIDFAQPQDDLYGVLLHEFGHVFGLGSSTDSASVLYQDATWVTTQLAASDVAAIQALYGAPAHSRSHNHTIQTAALIRASSDDGIPFTGTTPLVASGDLAAAGQNDVFAVQTLAYTGPMTFRLQTAGISLLAPNLIVYDASGNVLGTAQSTSVLGDVVTIHLDAVTANTTFYVGVEAATTGLFAVGRYGVAVTFDATLKTTPGQIAAMLSSAHGDSSDGNSFDDVQPGTIPALRTTRGYAANQHYEARGSLRNIVTYSFQSPLSPSGAPLVLTLAVSGSGDSGALARVQVLDANQQPVAGQMLINGAGGYTIQANGLAPGQTYYLKLTPPASANGEDVNFSLVADFNQTPALLPVLAAGSMTTTTSPATALYVALDQVFQFSLSAADAGAPAGSAVQMTIADADGNVVFTLTAPSGQTATGLPVLLTPGAYTVRLSLLTPGSTPASLTFQLRGAPITDTIGPVISNPTLVPMYTYPGAPFTYYYPNGMVSVSPYLLVPLAL